MVRRRCIGCGCLVDKHQLVRLRYEAWEGKKLLCRGAIAMCTKLKCMDEGWKYILEELDKRAPLGRLGSEYGEWPYIP